MSRNRRKRLGSGPAPVRRIVDEWTRLLFVNWVASLVADRLGPGQTGASEHTWTFGDPQQAPIKITLAPPAFRLTVDPGDAPRRDVRRIVDEAWKAAHAGNLGPGHWRRVAFEAKHEFFTAAGDLHFMRLLRDHPKRRLEGPVRFSNDVLLQFTQNKAEPSSLALPDFSVVATFRVPGPGPGPFTDRAAIELMTLLRAVLTYATAAPMVQQGPALWGASDAEVAEASQMLASADVGELTVDGNVLAQRIAEIAKYDPGQECSRRLRGGLFAYEQALLQASEFVSIVLFVSAIEALAVPNAEWHRRRLVKRFVRFVLQACPDVVQQTMNHGDFHQAFGDVRSERRFLEDLYDRRSRPLHTGFLQHNATGMFGLGMEGGIRVALVSDLVRGALRAFIAAPFSMTVGHPAIDPEQARADRS